jgi:hypothetical protein
LGRFIQADTLVPDPANPQSLNRFAYVRNNPLAFVDPSGHQPNDWYMHDFDGSDPSPLADLWMLRYQDNPSCPACSTASLDYVQWYGEHPGYAPENDRFLAKVNANDGVYGGILPSDVRDASLHYSLARTADQLAHGAGWEDLVISAVVENGPPLLFALGSGSKLRSEIDAATAESSLVGTKQTPIKIAPGTNGSTEIRGISYSGHAIDQMQGRGIPPSAVENTLQFGQRGQGKFGRTTFYESVNDLSVIQDLDETVVTVHYGLPSGGVR